MLWGALSNMTGMLARSREAVIGVYTVFMLPLMFLSSAFMQPGFLPGWMQAIASRNPLNWEVQVGRDVLSGQPRLVRGRRPRRRPARPGRPRGRGLGAHLPQLRQERLSRADGGRTGRCLAQPR